MRAKISRAEKLSLIEASYEGGVVISAIARRHGIDPKNLYRWRHNAKRSEALALHSKDSATTAATTKVSEEIRFVELIQQDSEILANRTSVTFNNLVISYKDLQLKLKDSVTIESLSAILQAMRRSC